jgi:hypothetical protein
VVDSGLRGASPRTILKRTAADSTGSVTASDRPIGITTAAESANPRLFRNRTSGGQDIQSDLDGSSRPEVT